MRPNKLLFIVGLVTLFLFSSVVSQATGINVYAVAAGAGIAGLLSSAPKGALNVASFATQLLRDVIRDHSQLDSNKGQQKFEMRTDEIGVMNAYYQDREKTLTGGDIAAIENLRSSQQAIDLYLYKKRAAGAGATRVRKGSGNSVPATVVPSFFTLIEEGMDMSFVNHSLRQYGSEGAEKQAIIKAAYQDHMSRELPQIFRNIYTRANAQFIAHLEANKWALTGTADKGSIYTTVLGDAKNVPNTVALIEILQNMQIESTQNNFSQLGRPRLIHSPTAMRIINEYLARGANNELNVQQFLAWFDAMNDNGIIDGAGDKATMYLVASGGLAGYSRVFPWETHPKAQGGVVNTGEDEWSNITIGGEDTMIFSGLPQIKLEVKTFTGYADNSATLPGNPDEGKIDIAESFSFSTQFGALTAYDQDANVSPILKYIVKS